jgi:endonuclease/exonuclease/phosphatase family metal-dependent hydrolase
VQVLSWNLLHGRSVPPAGRDLFPEFASALAGWPWDVALLQEVPPWWPPQLIERLGVDARWVLTSRNSLLALRRAIAVRWPDLIKSNGGGANAVLVRSGRIEEHRSRRLAFRPERRKVHAVRLPGIWIANLHSQARAEQVLDAATAVLDWAQRAPIVFGDDFNLRTLPLSGWTSAGSSGVDHIVVHGLEVTGPSRVLEASLPGGARLSDHAPLLAEVSRLSTSD